MLTLPIIPIEILIHEITKYIKDPNDLGLFLFIDKQCAMEITVTDFGKENYLEQSDLDKGNLPIESLNVYKYSSITNLSSLDLTLKTLILNSKHVTNISMLDELETLKLGENVVDLDVSNLPKLKTLILSSYYNIKNINWLDHSIEHIDIKWSKGRISNYIDRF